MKIYIEVVFAGETHRLTTEDYENAIRFLQLHGLFGSQREDKE